VLLYDALNLKVMTYILILVCGVVELTSDQTETLYLVLASLCTFCNVTKNLGKLTQVRWISQGLQNERGQYCWGVSLKPLKIPSATYHKCKSDKRWVTSRMFNLFAIMEILWKTVLFYQHIQILNKVFFSKTKL
jgi:hypothetical protein